jgi:hypothetical protein
VIQLQRTISEILVVLAIWLVVRTIKGPLNRI